MPDGQPISWHRHDEDVPLAEGDHRVPIDVRAGCVRLRGTLHVTDMPASLVDLVPSARCLADDLIAQVIADLRRQGCDVSCRAGCSACCRYLIPVSPPEAVSIWLELLHLPGPRRQAIMTRFLDIMRRIETHPLPDLAHLSEHDALQTLSDWYCSLQTTCPLLDANLCIAYPYRPLVCRECLTTFPPAACAKHQYGVGKSVVLPVSIAEVLYETAGVMLVREPESVILATLPDWVRTGSEPYDQSWPALDVAHTFLATLLRHADAAPRRRDDRRDEWTSAAST